MSTPRLPTKVRPFMVSISIRIDEDLQTLLGREASKQNKSKKDIVEVALREYLEKCNREAP